MFLNLKWNLRYMYHDWMKPRYFPSTTAVVGCMRANRRACYAFFFLLASRFEEIVEGFVCFIYVETSLVRSITYNYMISQQATEGNQGHRRRIRLENDSAIAKSFNTGASTKPNHPEKFKRLLTFCLTLRAKLSYPQPESPWKMDRLSLVPLSRTIEAESRQELNKQVC